MRRTLIIAALIALVPVNGIRIFCYRTLLGYKIGRSSKIGFLTLLAVSEVDIGDKVTVGSLNMIKGPIKLRIGSDTWIGRSNTINASWSIAEERFRDRNYARTFDIGSECVIQHDHYFDVYGLFKLGNRSWIVGRGSQFWTHGLSVEDRDIIVGEGNCITSAVRFAPGAAIGNENIVSMGAVVLSKIDADLTIISGYPAKVVRSIAEEKAAGKYHYSIKDW